MWKITILKTVFLKYYTSKVLIYQMGKVGSTSLEKSISGSIHQHTFFNNSPCFVESRQLSQKRSIYKKVRKFLLNKIALYAILAKKEVKIITMVRLSTERDISMFFQRFPYWYCEYLNNYNDKKISREDGSKIISNIYEKSFDHEYANTWFDKEIFRLTGIDVFNSAFEKDKGYQVYSRGKFKVLLMTVESINNCYVNGIIEDFIGEKFQLETSNESKYKWYAELMVTFKKDYRYSRKLLDNKLDGRLARHFYSESTIKRNRIKWLRV